MDPLLELQKMYSIVIGNERVQVLMIYQSKELESSS